VKARPSPRATRPRHGRAHHEGLQGAGLRLAGSRGGRADRPLQLIAKVSRAARSGSSSAPTPPRPSSRAAPTAARRRAGGRRQRHRDVLRLRGPARPQVRRAARTASSASGSWPTRAIKKIRKFTDKNGQYLWQPAIAAGQPATFDGKAVYEDPNLAAPRRPPSPSSSATSGRSSSSRWRSASRRRRLQVQHRPGRDQDGLPGRRRAARRRRPSATSSPRTRKPPSGPGRAGRAPPAPAAPLARESVKLLWISNAPWAPSGYGSQTRQVGPRIAKAGYDIEFVANDGTRGDQSGTASSSGLVGQRPLLSRDSVREDLERSGADWLIFLYDAWVYTEAGGPVRGRPARRGLGAGRPLPGPAVALRLAAQRATWRSR
jgi:hypothetical protein